MGWFFLLVWFLFVFPLLQKPAIFNLLKSLTNILRVLGTEQSCTSRWEGNEQFMFFHNVSFLRVQTSTNSN